MNNDEQQPTSQEVQDKQLEYIHFTVAEAIYWDKVYATTQFLTRLNAAGRLEGEPIEMGKQIANFAIAILNEHWKKDTKEET